MCGIIGLVPSEHSYFNNFCAASCKFPCHEKSESLQRGGGDWSKGLVTCKGIGHKVNIERMLKTRFPTVGEGKYKYRKGKN